MNNIVTIGLGYIGLPTSVILAAKGKRVYGVDINKSVVDKINKGVLHFHEPGLQDMLKEVVSKKLLRAGTKLDIKADVYLIVVPTPIQEHSQTPDLSYVEAAIRTIIPFLRIGDMVIIESTSPVGTTEKMYELIIEQRSELAQGIFMAYCPERVLPGNVIYELTHNDRIVGGINDESTRKAKEFYSSFVSGQVLETNSRTAEMCKLVENSSRDVQIAFANEVSIISEEAGVDYYELIDLANRHPRVNILRPGCGVGGHCIAVDPYFITSSFGEKSKLISAARTVNNSKPDFVIDQILAAERLYQDNTKQKPIVSIMGLAFKPDIDDLRESPALYIAKRIKQTDIDSNFIEPYVETVNGLDISPLDEAIANSQIIVFLVAHSIFKSIVKSIPKEVIVLDYCGVTKYD